MESWICLALIVVVLRGGLVAVIRSSVPMVIWEHLEHDISKRQIFNAMCNAAQKRGGFWKMFFDLRKWTFNQFYPNLGV